LRGAAFVKIAAIHKKNIMIMFNLYIMLSIFDRRDKKKM
jgi:hypothetical protein